MTRLLLSGLLFASLTACNDLAGTGELPSGVPDPNSLKTESGAMKMYQATLASFHPNEERQMGGYLTALMIGGMLTDEFQPSMFGGPPLSYIQQGDRGEEFSLDARELPEGRDENQHQYIPETYKLHDIRTKAAQAIGALQKYDPRSSPALRGHLYALAGYAEILLADLFCSGVPLSTFDFEGDFTYKPGSTTQQIYQHANALFDTAIALSSDSARIVNFARVGKGRALLNLGEYEAARLAVANVPDDFRYDLLVNWDAGLTGIPGTSGYITVSSAVTVADREGGNGFPYRSNNDPRTMVVENGTNEFGIPRYFPAKYGATEKTPVQVASGIEARLIESEALLHTESGDAWLAKLNALRTTGTQSEESWNPGIGQIAGLAPLSNPASEAERVQMIFDERAAWLFASGQRQGDLRRLLRNYPGRSESTVYPIGAYGPMYQQYGSYINLPIPSTEFPNPLFTGCFNRGA